MRFLPAGCREYDDVVELYPVFYTPHSRGSASTDALETRWQSLHVHDVIMYIWYRLSIELQMNDMSSQCPDSSVQHGHEYLLTGATNTRHGIT
jgi:hypothetical protein